MFIVDFDHTLFDTKAFKEARLEALRSLGVPDDVYWKTYEQARNDGTGTVTYTDERHAAAFAGTQFNRHKVLIALKNISENRIKEFLFSDAISFLKALRKLGKPIVLLSLGAPSFQLAKVHGTGVDHYVDDVIVVDDNKKFVLERLVDPNSQETVWLINDHIEETKNMKDMFPNIHPVLKRTHRDTALYEQSNIPFFDSLTEIACYVYKNS